jgi:hypothetical protein
MASRRPIRHIPKSTKATFVPKSMLATYEVIINLTDAFCRGHLNEDYRLLARRMTAALCRKCPSPLTSGQPRTWACGIVYVLGQINFLTDPSTRPFMTTASLCSWFGVGQSTASAKSRVISQALDTSRPILSGRCPTCWIRTR